MNIISLLGVIVLLGLAWLLSYDKKNVPYKIIVWGLGLQFIFALIILRQDIWSFIGMSILGTLIIIFQFREFSTTKIKPSQIIISLLILFGIYYCYSHNYTGRLIFQNFSEKVATFLSLSDYGSRFLFSNLADGQYYFPDSEAEIGRASCRERV